MLSIKMNVKVNQDRKIEIQLPTELSEGDMAWSTKIRSDRSWHE